MGSHRTKDAAAGGWPLPVLLVLAAAVALYAFLWRDGPESGPDTPSYLAAAGDLADWRLDALHLRTPGYPLLLRALGGNPGFSLVLVQLLLHAAGIWALAGLLAEIGLGRRGIVAFVLAGWLPHVVQLAKFVLSESLAASLLMLGFAGLGRAALGGGRPWHLAGTSVAFGLLAITRPVYVATAPCVAALVALAAMKSLGREARPRLLRAAAIVPVGTVLFVGALALYQQQRFGAPASSQVALSLAARMAAYYEVLPDDEPVREILIRHRNATMLERRHHRNWNTAFAWEEMVELFGGDERRAARELLRLDWEILRREPRNYLLAVWRSLAEYWEWYSRGVAGLRSLPAAITGLVIHSATVLAFASLLATALVAALFSLGLPGEARRKAFTPITASPAAGIYLLATSVVLLHMLLQCALGVGEARYRLPSDPLVLTSLAAAGIVLASLRRRLLSAPLPG